MEGPGVRSRAPRDMALSKGHASIFQRRARQRPSNPRGIIHPQEETCLIRSGKDTKFNTDPAMIRRILFSPPWLFSARKVVPKRETPPRYVTIRAPLLRGLRRADRRDPVVRALPHALLLAAVPSGALGRRAQNGLQGDSRGRAATRTARCSRASSLASRT